MNNLSFTGRLAADAEKRFTQNGTAILSFTRNCVADFKGKAA